MVVVVTIVVMLAILVVVMTAVVTFRLSKTIVTVREQIVAFPRVSTFVSVVAVIGVRTVVLSAFRTNAANAAAFPALYALFSCCPCLESSC